MPINASEIVAGVVAYLDAEALTGDHAVTKPLSPTTRSGPFLCFDLLGHSSAWGPISTQFRPERLLIRQEWRTGGSHAWRNRDQYLNDGATVYFGPNESFAAASTSVDIHTAANRPKVLPDGVAAVLAEVKDRGGIMD